MNIFDRNHFTNECKRTLILYVTRRWKCIRLQYICVVCCNYGSSCRYNVIMLWYYT